MRNQPITRVRAKNGSRAGQEASKRRQEREAGGGEKALLLTREGESCRRQSSAVGEARPSTGQRRREGPSDPGEGATVSSCPMCAPEPLWDLQAVWLEILLQKLRKMEKRCLTLMSSKLTRQDVFCDLEREKGRDCERERRKT